MNLIKRAAPITGRAMAAKSARNARTLNVRGVWEIGAENQSNPANKRRMATTPQTPGRIMKHRTSAVSFSGCTKPYIDMAMINAENMARASVIGTGSKAGW